MSKDYRHSRFDDFDGNEDYHFKSRNKGSNKFMNRRNKPKHKGEFRNKHLHY